MNNLKQTIQKATYSLENNCQKIIQHFRAQLSQNKLLSEVKKIGRKFICPHCGSKNTHWKGYRKTTKGRKRLRKCTDCSRKFSTKILL